MTEEIMNSGQSRLDAIAGRLTFEQGRNRIIGRDENGLARMTIVADGDTFRMRVSETGVDVLIADDDQIIFDSDNNIFKIVEKVTINVTKAINTTGNQNTATLAADLPAFPVIIASVTPFVGFSGVVQAPYLNYSVTGVLLMQCQVVQSGVRTLQAQVLTPNTAGGYYGTALVAKFDIYVMRETAILP